MKFAICNEMFEGWAFEDVCRAARDTGYSGIEIAPFTLGRPPDEVGSEARQRMRETAGSFGLEIVGLHWLLAQTEGFHVNHPDSEVRRRTALYLESLVELCADLGGSVMVFGSPKQRSVCSGVTEQQAWEYALETFRKVVPALESRGVTLCLEPLGPEETDFINTADEAARFIREVGSPAIGLLLDVKAMSTEGRPIPDIIRANSSLLKHFHANDASRRGPGFGETDFHPIAAALKETGYRGWVSVEVFDFSPDPLTIAARSMEYLSRVFKGDAI